MELSENYIVRHPEFTGYIGLSRKDITPPAGIYSRNWGAAVNDIAKGVHRPLTLTCCTFQESPDRQPLVLIGADLGWWKNAEYELRLRSKILDELSLPASHLMFCLSHTHAGPGLCPDDEHKPGGKLIQPYLDEVANYAVEAIGEALQVSAPAVLTWHTGTCNLATNRDLPEPGGDRILTGLNPDIPADDTLLVGRISDAKGKIIGALINYACHPTTLAWDNQLISPDYIGGMREVVEGNTGAPCLFLQGASGDLAPAEQYSGDTELADRYGRQLGYAVMSTLSSMQKPATGLKFKEVIESGATLALWTSEKLAVSGTAKAEMVGLEFPLKDFPLLKEIEEEWARCEDPVIKERLWRKRCIRKAIGDGNTATIPLWVWQLGDSFLAGQPNEPYSEFQTTLRDAFPEHAIAVMNIVNGSVGYLPPRQLYTENAYAVWQTPFAAGSLDILKNTTIETIQNLIAG